MIGGLGALEIQHKWNQNEWRKLCTTLCEKNGNSNLGIYLHVTRGADNKRNHAYPLDITPTVFAFTFEKPEPPAPNRDTIKPYSCSTASDLRWDRCNIKSISLLGNVMHYQQGHVKGDNEILLYNEKNELTECGACNAFIVKDGVVITPPLDTQILSGITRALALKVIREDGSIPLEERIITMDEVRNADEVWISSSSKELMPVTKVDGKAGAVWEAAAKLYQEAGKFNF